jgi:hypothetical protein
MSLNHSTKASVKIGPSFFAKEKKDYADWRWAWVRELAQNSIDAPKCDRIEFNIVFDGTHTIASCTNNGAPMTREILTEKFLSIGESGKGFSNGSIGGFGKAKVIIAFSHETYSIRTGTLLVNGSGAEYELFEGQENFHGTTTTIKMAGDEAERLIQKIKIFCAYAQWSGAVHINGEEMACDLRKGSPRRDLSMGKVYTNKSFENTLIVRIGGIPMFRDWIEFNRCVIVELNGVSGDVLTSNRDSLTYDHREALSEFVRELATDKKRALKNRQARYQRFDGAKLRHRIQKSVSVRDLVATPQQRTGAALAAFASMSPHIKAVVSPAAGGLQSEETVGVYNPERVGVLAGIPEDAVAISSEGIAYAEEISEPVSQIAEEFVIRNETDMLIPAYYLPDSPAFGSYGRKLARMWGRLLLELHRVFEHEAEFSIGFGFDEDAEASHEEGEFGRVYYINPAVIVKQTNSESKSFKKRFQLTERNRLLAIAAHEFVHGLGFSRHDSEFASKLTDVLAKVMDERKRFNWAFQ